MAALLAVQRIISQDGEPLIVAAGFPSNEATDRSKTLGFAAFLADFRGYIVGPAEAGVTLDSIENRSYPTILITNSD